MLSTSDETAHMRISLAAATSCLFSFLCGASKGSLQPLLCGFVTCRLFKRKGSRLVVESMQNYGQLKMLSVGGC